MRCFSFGIVYELRREPEEMQLFGALWMDEVTLL